MRMQIRRQFAQVLFALTLSIFFLFVVLGYAKTIGEVYLVKDINSSGDSSPLMLTNVNGTLYFFADDGTHGIEL